MRMVEQNDSADKQHPAEFLPSGKKKYEKPAFRFERVFETMALTCGKVGAVEFQCRFNRKTS
jgi:hypothetical protein